MTSSLLLSIVGVAIAAPMTGPPTVQYLCRSSDTVVVGVVQPGATLVAQPTGNSEIVHTASSFEVETILHGQPPANLQFKTVGDHIGGSVMVPGMPSWAPGTRHLLGLNWFPGNSVGMEPQWVRVVDWVLPAEYPVPPTDTLRMMYREHCAEHVDGVPPATGNPTEEWVQSLGVPVDKFCSHYTKIPGAKGLQLCASQ